MKRQLRNEKGFTLIELIMVIAIVGILAAVALPVFQNLTDDAQNAKLDGTAGAIQSGISLVYAQNLANGSSTFPVNLDSASNAACSTTNACFGSVLQYPVNDSSWTKLSGTQYRFDGVTPAVTCTYSNVSGTFTCP